MFRRILCVLVLTMVLTQASRAQVDQKELAEIAKTVSYYTDGGTFGDSVLFSKAFHKGGLMQFMRNDTLQTVTLKDFAERARNNRQVTQRVVRIDQIQVYGNAAVAKVTIEMPTFYFHDLLSLLKTREGWKIVGKIFYREDKVK